MLLGLHDKEGNVKHVDFEVCQSNIRTVGWR
jgi:hypothetical protein